MALYKMLEMAFSHAKSYVYGEINVTPTGLCYSDKGYTNSRGKFFKAIPDDTGRLASVKKIQCVSNCPDPPPSTPRTTAGKVVKTNVPYNLCRICTHYIEPDYKDFNYSCCGLLKQNRRVGNGER